MTALQAVDPQCEQVGNRVGERGPGSRLCEAAIVRHGPGLCSRSAGLPVVQDHSRSDVCAWRTSRIRRPASRAASRSM